MPFLSDPSILRSARRPSLSARSNQAAIPTLGATKVEWDPATSSWKPASSLSSLPLGAKVAIGGVVAYALSRMFK